jgi:hypothetical protein
MNLNRISAAALIALVGLLLIVTASPISVQAANGETASNYWVTVNPTTPSSPMYAPVGQNWTVSFEALWNYGVDSGQAIRNATVTVKVTTATDMVVNTLQLNTTAGVFSLNYSSSTADILTFAPTKLVTQEGVEYNSTLLQNEGNNTYGFQSKSVTVWWDTFRVSFVNSNTSAQGITAVSVNVTYLLIPEEGLTLPQWATYSNQTFLPKIVHGATVTVNGVKAEESLTAGIYAANVSTLFPTAYIHVGVSQEGWVTTHTGFSFAHNANQPIWEYSLLIGFAFVVAVLTLRFLLLRKLKGTILLRRTRYPMFGGIMLAVASLVSLYWGLVGLDSTLHGFDWALLSISGLVAFGFGLAGAVMSMRKKQQALAILAVCLPLIVNLVAVKSALDGYQLAIPWLTIVIATAVSIVSGLLISNSDEQFR